MRRQRVHQGSNRARSKRIKVQSRIDDDARTLRGTRLATWPGWMRADDHQLFEPLYMIAFARVNGYDVKYDMEHSGTGMHTETRFEINDLLRPTSCHMERPSGH